MPGMDGWSVMTALKTDPLTAEIPVVMVSIEDGEHRRFALGVSDFLVKPFDRPRLIKVLHRQLGSGSSGKVLIIDDDQQNREMLDRIIRKEGFEVMQAVNGRQGLEQVQADPPRLILLDLMMPEMNGFEFLAELRHRESSYEIPVVVLTAKDLGPKVRAQFSEVAEAILEQGTRTGEEMQMVVRRLLVRAMGAQSNVMNQT